MEHKIQTGEWNGEPIRREPTLREREIIREKIDDHGKAIREGNFGKANAIKNYLEALGVDADFETAHEPQYL